MKFWMTSVTHGSRAKRERLTVTTTYHAGNERAFGQYVGPLATSDSFQVNGEPAYVGVTPSGRGRILVCVVEERTFALHRLAQLEFLRQFDDNYHTPEDVRVCVDYHEELDYSWDNSGLNHTSYVEAASNLTYSIGEVGLVATYSYPAGWEFAEEAA